MGTRVFVYGTLRRGQGNHDWHLAKARYVGRASLAGYRMHSLRAFPGICKAHGETGAVRGEVYEVDGPTLAKLDSLEGVPRLYQRTRLTLADGTRADVYTMSERALRGYPVVPSGDWLDAKAGEIQGRPEAWSD